MPKPTPGKSRTTNKQTVRSRFAEFIRANRDSEFKPLIFEIMNVQIQSVKFDADQRLVEFVHAKMAKLERFAERTTGAEVILKLDKDREKGNKIATITLRMPGEELVADRQARSFEEAVDEAIDALKRQLDKVKTKAEK